MFGFIDYDMMRKQDDDTVEDFREVFNFQAAFDEPFRHGLPESKPDARDS